MALSLYARSERRCGIPTGLHTFHDISRHSGNDNRVFHRPAFPQQYGGFFFKKNGSRYKMVLDWVQRYLGRVFDLKLLLGRLRLTLEYVWQTLSGRLYGQPDIDYTADFQDFASNVFRPIFWMGAFIGLTHFVIVSGVEKGIERASKIMMPLLFLILLIMCVRSVTLPNAEAGLLFPFQARL